MKFWYPIVWPLIWITGCSMLHAVTIRFFEGGYIAIPTLAYLIIGIGGGLLGSSYLDKALKRQYKICVKEEK